MSWFSFSLHRSITAPQRVGTGPIGIQGHRWLNSGCWAVREPGIGADNLFDESPMGGNENGSLLGGLDDSSSAPFGTVEAEITAETSDFFVSDAEGDPDCPTEGFSSIEQALNMLCQGKVCSILCYGVDFSSLVLFFCCHFSCFREPKKRRRRS